MAASLESRMKELEAQANASGMAVELDEGDAMLAEFLSAEGLHDDTGSEGDEDEEMQELVDVMNGVEILACDSQHR